MRASCAAYALSLSLVLPATVAFVPQQRNSQIQRGVPSVTSRLLPDALAILKDSGFVNVRVARVLMDDMPRNVVVWQFPEATGPNLRGGRGGRGALPVPVTTEIWLVVVEPLPVLPDLVGWRADRAVAHVAAIDRELAAFLDEPQADATQRVVTGQSVPAGPIQPPARVLLTTAPLTQDTFFLRDTLLATDTVNVTRVDTVVVSAPPRPIQTGLTPVQVLIGGIVLTLAGLGLGMLACRMAGPVRAPPPISGRVRNVKPDRDDSGGGKGRPNLPEFVSVIVDEAVWTSAGRLRASRPDEGGEGA